MSEERQNKAADQLEEAIMLSLAHTSLEDLTELGAYFLGEDHPCVVELRAALDE